MKEKLSEQDLWDIGFDKLPHFTVSNSLIYQLGRNRHLSIGSIGTPNEVMFICQSDEEDLRIITDLVCIHNYDYDGYLKLEKVNGLIRYLQTNK